MPFNLSIQPVIDAQTTALTTAINAARDAVNTNTNSKTGDVTTAINTARDAINSNTDNDVAALTTAVNAARDVVNTNTNTKTGDVTNAVNARGAIKSVQRGTVAPYQGGFNTTAIANVTIAAVNIGKSVINVSGFLLMSGTASGSARITSSTNLEVKGWVGGGAGATTEIQWEVIEFF
jgi:DNA-binding protein YbaB